MGTLIKPSTTHANHFPPACKIFSTLYCVYFSVFGHVPSIRGRATSGTTQRPATAEFQVCIRSLLALPLFPSLPGRWLSPLHFSIHRPSTLLLLYLYSIGRHSHRSVDQFSPQTQRLSLISLYVTLFAKLNCLSLSFSNIWCVSCVLSVSLRVVLPLSNVFSATFFSFFRLALATSADEGTRRLCGVVNQSAGRVGWLCAFVMHPVPLPPTLFGLMSPSTTRRRKSKKKR